MHRRSRLHCQSQQSPKYLLTITSSIRDVLALDRLRQTLTRLAQHPHRIRDAVENSGLPKLHSGKPIPSLRPLTLLTTNYRTHEKSHGRSDDRPFKCEICDRGFLWQKDLTRHMPKHSGKKDFVCPVDWCDKSYTRRDNMVRHHDDVHPEIPPLSRKHSDASSASGKSRSFRH